MIVKNPRILSNEWMLIGQQEYTDYVGRIDTRLLRFRAKGDGVSVCARLTFKPKK